MFTKLSTSIVINPDLLRSATRRSISRTEPKKDSDVYLLDPELKGAFVVADAQEDHGFSRVVITFLRFSEETSKLFSNTQELINPIRIPSHLSELSLPEHINTYQNMVKGNDYIVPISIVSLDALGYPDVRLHEKYFLLPGKGIYLFDSDRSEFVRRVPTNEFDLFVAEYYTIGKTSPEIRDLLLDDLALKCQQGIISQEILHYVANPKILLRTIVYYLGTKFTRT